MGVFPSRQLVSAGFSQNHKSKLVQVVQGARYFRLAVENRALEEMRTGRALFS